MRLLRGLIFASLSAILISPTWSQTDGQCTVNLDVEPLKESLNDILSNAPVPNEVADFGLSAPFMSNSPTADGMISAGEYSNTCFFSFADRENPGNPFPSLDTIEDTGDADLSANVHLAHTDQFLYLGFEVTDEFLDLDEGVNAFTNDSIELFLNADLEPDDYTPEDGRNDTLEGYQIVADAAGGGDIAFNNRSSSVSLMVPIDSNDPPPEEGEFFSAGLTTDTGYVVEFEIPLASLDTESDFSDSVTPAKTGDVMFMNFAINDNDFEGASGQDTHAMLWVVEDDVRSPFGGGENVWVVPMELSEGGNPCDVNGDGNVDDGDIDAMAAAIAAGETDARYDLNKDGSVTIEDRTFLIEDSTKIGTFFGDSNLDGEFNSGDLVAVFTIGEYEDGIAGNSGWAAGDWNGDMEFDSTDFVIAFQSGGYEQGPRAAVSSVPEPSSWLMAAGLFSVLALRRRK